MVTKIELLHILKWSTKAENWTRIIALCDIFKGVVGLTLSIYLTTTLLPLVWLSQDQNLTNFKIQFEDSILIYILTYGVTKYGVIASIVGLLLWNFLLVVFGSLLLSATKEKSVRKLRMWYVHTFTCNLTFVGLFIWFVLSSRQCPHSGSFWARWTLKLVYSLSGLSFFTASFSLGMTQSLMRSIQLAEEEKLN